MNTNHDELERLLGEELNDRAGDIGGARLHFGDVRGRATSIRRRRRVAAGAGVAAVLAVAVPLRDHGGRLGSTDQAGAAARPAPPKVAQTTLTLDGLERGDPPRIEYFTADGVVLPGDGLQRLDDELPGDGAEQRHLAGAQPRALRAAVAERGCSSRPTRCRSQRTS